MQPVPMKSLRMLVSLIKGPDNRGDMNYEKEGDAYRELVTLLKDKSAHFTEMIDKQVTCWFFLNKKLPLFQFIGYNSCTDSSSHP